jgi:hypothetical protein
MGTETVKETFEKTRTGGRIRAERLFKSRMVRMKIKDKDAKDVQQEAKRQSRRRGPYVG